jgi:hypothetical protein
LDLPNSEVKVSFSDKKNSISFRTTVFSVTMQIYNKCISKALEEAFYLLEQFIIDLKNMEALVSN